MFADDLIIFLSCQTPALSQSILQNTVNRLQIWTNTSWSRIFTVQISGYALLSSP
ncbi:hypothetical protein PGB90_010677 [Kerria lacca]